MKNETECVGFDSFNKDCKAHRVFSQCRSCRGGVGFYRCSDLHATRFSVYIVTCIMNCRDVCGLGGDQLKAALCKDQGCSCSIYPHISIIVFLMSRRTMRLAKSFGRQLMSMATGFSPSQKSQRFWCHHGHHRFWCHLGHHYLHHDCQHHHQLLFREWGTWLLWMSSLTASRPSIGILLKTCLESAVVH